MPIIIAGMHRSGTSMVARLLNLCGLELGDPQDHIQAEEDNPEGYWEHRAFHALNEQILDVLEGAWDVPPHMDLGRPAGVLGASQTEKLAELRARAEELIAQFQGREPWGWKDPRNSLTLWFWLDLIPDAKVVIPIRNPLDVANSLGKRAYASQRFSLNLWTSYMRSLEPLLSKPQTVITHFSSYFIDSRAELSRVLGALDMPADPERVREACQAVTSKLRHSTLTYADLFVSQAPVETVKLYRDSCLLAGPVYAPTMQKESDEVAWWGNLDSHRARFYAMDGQKPPGKIGKVLKAEGMGGLARAVGRKLRGR